jgi:DNA-binding XRE family transcriptional regulator
MSQNRSTRAARFFHIVALGEERRRLGITQAQLAKKAGCHPWTISQLERGLRGCQRSTRDAIYITLIIMQQQSEEKSANA